MAAPIPYQCNVETRDCVAVVASWQADNAIIMGMGIDHHSPPPEVRVCHS